MHYSALVATITAGLLAIATLAGAGAALGQGTRSAGEAAIADAKVTLAQAIATAEQQIGGKALEVEIERQNGAAFFKVKVVKDGQTHKVLVDTRTGEVVRASLDEDRQGDRRASDDDDERQGDRRASDSDDDDDDE